MLCRKCSQTRAFLFLHQYHLYMKLIPQNKNIVCKCISSDEKTTESGFTYKSNDVKLYEVVSVSKSLENEAGFDIKIGDRILVNSTGTKVEVNGEEYYMFNVKNVMGKIN